MFVLYRSEVTKTVVSVIGNTSTDINSGWRRVSVTFFVPSEVKNYSNTLSYTSQLKDFVMWSQREGFEMHLYTNANLSKPLQELVNDGTIKLFPLG